MCIRDRCMAERACVVEGDLSDTIDQLYEGQWINKATKDNYHTIRILGNKAVHEGEDVYKRQHMNLHSRHNSNDDSQRKCNPQDGQGVGGNPDAGGGSFL